MEEEELHTCVADSVAAVHFRENETQDATWPGTRNVDIVGVN